MREQDLKESFKELMKLMKGSIETFGKYTKAKATGVTGDELAKLESVKTANRVAFDNRLAAVIGDVSTDEGKAKNRDWGFYVQKSFVLGLVKSNAFRYLDPRYAESLRLSAESYVAGHKVLGWTVEHGLNPRSAQTLAAALEKAGPKIREEGDPDKYQQFQAALSGLKRHAGHLLTKKVEQQKSGSFTAAQALPTGAAQVMKQAITPAPAPTPVVTKTPVSEKGDRPTRKRR